MRLTLTLLLALFLLAAQAMAAETRSPNLWTSALLSGSQRLGLYTLAQEAPAGSRPYALRLARELGFAQRGLGLTHLDHGVSLTPTLEFDPNINGGMPGETIMLGPYEFSIDEEWRSRSGYLGGLSASARTSWSYAPKSTLHAGAVLSYQHDLKSDLEVRRGSLLLCQKQHIHRWTWMDACLQSFRTERDLSTSEGTTASFGLGHVFSSPLGTHDVGVTFKQLWDAEYEKKSVYLRATSAVAGLGALTFGLDVGEAVDLQTTQLHSITVALTRPIFGRRTSIVYNQSFSAGGRVFGMEREDRARSLTLSRPLNEWFGISLSWKRVDSTIDNYDEDIFWLGGSVSSWKF